MSDSRLCCLRMDDIGASSKLFEVYSKNLFGNILFLKYLEPYRAWGPYEELNSDEWCKIIDLLIKHKSKLTVGITASWVDKSGDLIPFPEKFPKQAKLLKHAMYENIIEIANHGLSHCIIGKHLPHYFTSNRIFHREFWNWLPREIHFTHLKKSQQILQEWLGKNTISFIPPGNVYSYDTIEAAFKNRIEIINANKILYTKLPIKIRDLTNVIPFHDREIKLNGMQWFENLIINNVDNEHLFVREL